LSSLSRSLCLALDDFYQDIDYVFVSSVTGEGFDQLHQKIPKLQKEYTDVYLKDLQAKIAALGTNEEKKEDLVDN
jgi:hypothetical protein